MQWLRRSLIAGFVVTVPLVISVGGVRLAVPGGRRALWSPVYAQWLGREVPGLGLVTLLAVVLVVGALTTNVLGRRLFDSGRAYLLRLPVFRAVYGPVKQLVAAFSPDNQLGFKRVVLADDPKRGLVLGFLTKSSAWSGTAGPST